MWPLSRPHYAKKIKFLLGLKRALSRLYEPLRDFYYGLEQLPIVAYPTFSYLNYNRVCISLTYCISPQFLPVQLTFSFPLGEIHPKIVSDHRIQVILVLIYSSTIALHEDTNLSIQNAKRFQLMTFGSHVVSIFHSAQNLFRYNGAHARNTSRIIG